MITQEVEDVRVDPDLKEIWSQAVELLRKRLSAAVFQTVIVPSQLIEFKDSEAVLAVNNSWAKDTLSSKNCASAINEVLEQILRRKVDYKVIVDPALQTEFYTPSIASISEAPRAATAQPSKINHVQTAASQIASNLNPKNTFDTFVVGSHNRFSHSAAMAVSSNPGQAYSPLFIYGGVGLGKTHIMQAIGNQIRSQSPQLVVRYMSCEKFTNELINSIRDDRMIDFRKRYRQVDVLLMDDIQFIEGKESTQEEFFHTFNALRESGRQIVLSSDRPPKALSRLEERLRSRFEWGLISDIGIPDLETRMAILRKKCELERMVVPDQVLEYIATLFTSNIRELEGALLRAHAFANLTGSELNVSTISGVLHPGTPAQTSKPALSIEKIMDTVAAFFRVEPSELKSANRSQDLTLPRHIAMYLTSQLMHISLPRIGEAFGNRKHTSALHAIKKIKELINTDPATAESVRQITRQLGY